jgi:hypothetical protein
LFQSVPSCIGGPRCQALCAEGAVAQGYRCGL